MTNHSLRSRALASVAARTLDEELKRYRQHSARSSMERESNERLNTQVIELNAQVNFSDSAKSWSRLGDRSALLDTCNMLSSKFLGSSSWEQTAGR